MSKRDEMWAAMEKFINIAIDQGPEALTRAQKEVEETATTTNNSHTLAAAALAQAGFFALAIVCHDRAVKRAAKTQGGGA